MDKRLMELARRIRLMIESSRYSAADVARNLEVDKSSVARWMSGERTPTVQNLIDLAALLGVEAKDLWDGPHAMPTTPEQRAMLEKMQEMTPEQQQALLALAATMNR